MCKRPRSGLFSAILKSLVDLLVCSQMFRYQPTDSKHRRKRNQMGQPFEAQVQEMGKVCILHSRQFLRLPLTTTSSSLPGMGRSHATMVYIPNYAGKNSDLTTIREVADQDCTLPRLECRASRICRWGSFEGIRHFSQFKMRRNCHRYCRKCGRGTIQP